MVRGSFRKGTLIPAPAVPVAGGYGWTYIGRSNEIGSIIKVNEDGCEIRHGTEEVERTLNLIPLPSSGRGLIGR